MGFTFIPSLHFHQCPGDVAFLWRESAGYLPQTVVYQLSHLDVAIAHHIGIVHYIHIFSQLIGTDGRVRYQYCLRFFAVWQGDADIKSAFQ